MYSITPQTLQDYRKNLNSQQNSPLNEQSRIVLTPGMLAELIQGIEEFKEKFAQENHQEIPDYRINEMMHLREGRLSMLIQIAFFPGTEEKSNAKTKSLTEDELQNIRQFFITHLSIDFCYRFHELFNCDILPFTLDMTKDEAMMEHIRNKIEQDTIASIIANSDFFEKAIDAFNTKFENSQVKAIHEEEESEDALTSALQQPQDNDEESEDALALALQQPQDNDEEKNVPNVLNQTRIPETFPSEFKRALAIKKQKEGLRHQDIWKIWGEKEWKMKSVAEISAIANGKRGYVATDAALESMKRFVSETLSQVPPNTFIPIAYLSLSPDFINRVYNVIERIEHEENITRATLNNRLNLTPGLLNKMFYSQSKDSRKKDNYGQKTFKSSDIGILEDLVDKNKSRASLEKPFQSLTTRINTQNVGNNAEKLQQQKQELEQHRLEGVFKLTDVLPTPSRFNENPGKPY
jgi:hypothetical protein